MICGNVRQDRAVHRDELRQELLWDARAAWPAFHAWLTFRRRQAFQLFLDQGLHHGRVEDVPRFGK